MRVAVRLEYNSLMTHGPPVRHQPGCGGPLPLTGLIRNRRTKPQRQTTPYPVAYLYDTSLVMALIMVLLFQGETQRAASA